ncbi:MAG: hypothetical protein N3D80_01185, partial [Ignavibacterium album]|uniref:hypothetical protein n=1 Tax=Ignavibacterium album TaxID=591197 RepID=UPI0026F186EF
SELQFYFLFRLILCFYLLLKFPFQTLLVNKSGLIKPIGIAQSVVIVFNYLTILGMISSI